MLTIKFDVEKFDRKINFSLWHVRMLAILVQNGIQKALGVRPDGMTDTRWEEMDEKARSTIQLSLTNEVFWEVISEKTTKSLWENLESLSEKDSDE